ncbi:predicted protein [Chaetoceros tenuissimus]|uniref:Uncharacterized protein n=1 Tax=Chaetoceros tenuissimus TaxID=426638 RepID=A0AAD3H9V7_9STRA|nr:predicted protein [Chaetoceros tenuissimus]
MGKKGKRSKQKDVRKEADKIIREADQLTDKALIDAEEGLYSKAANQNRQAIRLLESKKVAMVHTRLKHLFKCYFLFMHVEYQRRNYKAALDWYKYIMSKSRQNSLNFRGNVILFHQLSMLRLNGQKCQLSDFIHYISRKSETPNIIYIEAIFAFRAH